MSETGRVAIVTGGSRGIGAAICQHLARQGMRVHLVYRDAGGAAEQVAQAVTAEGGTITLHRADVSDEAQVAALVARIDQQEGAVDVLVNNAGIIDDTLAMAMSFAQWRRVMAVNLDAPFLMARAVLPLMLDTGWGRIINISSVSARIPGSGQGSYAASKGGLEALTRALAAEVGHKGIRVNAVAPGRVQTDMTDAVAAQLGPAEPGKRWGVPDDVAAMVAFLASEQADYINGQTINVDGGRTTTRPRIVRARA